MAQILDNENFSVDIFPLGPIGTNVGVIVDKEERTAIVVDAPPESFANLSEWSQSEHIRVTTLLITHEHWDHITDTYFFQEIGAKIYAHSVTAHLLEHPNELDSKVMTHFKLSPCSKVERVSPKQSLSIGSLNIEVLDLSGHAPGGIGFLFRDLSLCFVGDTLFAYTVGRSDFHNSDKHKLFKNIRENLYTLPDETVIIPGHGRLTTIGAEKTGNLYVRERPNNL